MLDLIGAVNSIFHPLLAPNTSHQALSSFDMVTGTQSRGGNVKPVTSITAY